MKKTCGTIALLGLALMPLAAGVSAQVDWVSRYVWRGFDLNGNRPCLQPQATLELGKSGFTLNLWSCFCLKDRAETKQADEIDATLSYAIPAGESFELEAGAIVYAYVGARPFKFKEHTTPEVYLKGGLPHAPLAPSLALYYDLNLGKGFYAQLSVEHSLKLSGKLALDLSGALGYNGRMYIENSGFSDLAFGAALPITLGQATLTPAVHYSISLLDSVNEDDEFWLGMSVQF
ncbi:MAG TPA: hypothetical protein PKK12_04965 [Candidatus Aminicenantes bacterium]|nr:hypothetical protein [Candidatus Aminicenantes bacterium]